MTTQQYYRCEYCKQATTLIDANINIIDGKINECYCNKCKVIIEKTK